MDEHILEQLSRAADRNIEELRAFLRLPSVASQRHGVRECARWLADYMARIGIPPLIAGPAEFPVIMGEVRGRTGRSMLIYCHYDVQPADEPEWRHPPFAAEIEDGRLYGRGTVDDKGALIASLQAVRAYLECGTPPPITVKFLFEGEEEIGSPSLPPVLRQHHAFLDCDALVNLGDNSWPDGRPRVVCGIKGICLLRLEARTRREFHEMMAPLVANPLLRIVGALATLAAADGRIVIPGFFDDVLPPTARDMEVLADLRWTGRELLAASGQAAFVGGQEPLDALRAWILEPSFNLQGLTGGYVAPQDKGVVPNFAAAEVRFGLVPKQTPERVFQLVRDHLAASGFGDIDVQLVARNPWARTVLARTGQGSPVDSEIVQTLVRALDRAFGRGVAIQHSFAGSGPEGVFQEMFPNMAHAYACFGPTEDNLHAPNEYVVIADQLTSIEAVARIYDEYARSAAAPPPIDES